MLSTQNEMIFFNIPLISLKKLIVENLQLTVACLASMQFSKDTGFDKGKLSVMAFLNNLHLFQSYRSTMLMCLSVFSFKCFFSITISVFFQYFAILFG